MAMAVDSRQQPHLLTFDPLRYPVPQFTNPWGSASSNAVSQQELYSPAQATSSGLAPPQAVQQRPTSLPGPYSTIHDTAPSLAPISTVPATIYGNSQVLLNSRQYAPQFSIATTSSEVPTSTPSYALGFPRPGYGFQQEQSRRSPHPINPIEAQRDGFSVLDPTRGILSLNQSDITPTPRNPYGDQSGRSSPESYGFPSTHSAHSSISSASGFGAYYPSSVGGESSLTDYSSASESVDLSSRTLPRPQGLMATNPPPAPQSMMSQFSSKIPSSSQKKHKCKVCDKRFTRPSSLQTHMYSHTGEKPFACEVEGCGRHFSVVSNLRRHRKVHKNEPDQDDDA